MVIERDSPPSENANPRGDDAIPHMDTDDDSEVEEAAPVEPLSIKVAGVSLMDQNGEDEPSNSDDEQGEMEFDDEEDPMSVLPSYVVHRVNKLKELHGQREAIMDEYLKERAALELKYQTLCAPLYTERSGIVNGFKDREISEETKTGDDIVEGSVTAGMIDEKGKDIALGIPQFWVCAMGHMEAVAESITEEDVDCLENLTDIKCFDDVDGHGFTLEFHFRPNDYFQNSVLTKRYEVPNLLLADEPILKNVEGCKINWLPNKCLTYREVIKKQRGKGKHAGQLRNVKKQERRDSFFHFFEPPKMPSMESMDEDEADRLEELFDGDYDLAQAFRSHIIPNAVLWFTGQAMEDEMQEMLAMSEFARDGDSHLPSPFPAPTSGEENPECKQN